MAVHVNILELVIWWTVYAVSTDFVVLFLRKYFIFVANCTKTKHSVYL